MAADSARPQPGTAHRFRGHDENVNTVLHSQPPFNRSTPDSPRVHDVGETATSEFAGRRHAGCVAARWMQRGGRGERQANPTLSGVPTTEHRSKESGELGVASCPIQRMARV